MSLLRDFLPDLLEHLHVSGGAPFNARPGTRQTWQFYSVLIPYCCNILEAKDILAVTWNSRGHTLRQIPHQNGRSSNPVLLQTSDSDRNEISENLRSLANNTAC